MPAETEKETLALFQAVTGLAPTEARLVLDEHHWNLEAAVSSILDAPTSTSTTTTSTTTTNPGLRQRRRVEEWRLSLSAAFVDLVASTLGFPRFRLCSSSTMYSALSSELGSYPSIERWWIDRHAPLGPFRKVLEDILEPGRASLPGADPTAAAQAFCRHYEAEYGSLPPFQPRSYSQVLDSAKRNLQFMIAYLHAPDHQDTPTFCRETLNAGIFCDYIASHEMLLWGGSIYDSEAYRASTLLQVTEYPFLAIICYKEGRMQVVDRLQGLCSAEVVIQRISDAVEQHGQTLAMARADRQELEMARQIREQQDRAYQESLEADRKKELERKQKEREEQQQRELAQRQQQESQQKEQDRVQKRKALAASLPPEPRVTDLGTCKVVFRLPNGERLDRRFFAKDTVELLYHFAGAQDLAMESDRFVICTNFPKTYYRDRTQTLQEAGLTPNAIVFVEEVLEEVSGQMEQQ